MNETPDFGARVILTSDGIKNNIEIGGSATMILGLLEEARFQVYQNMAKRKEVLE